MLTLCAHKARERKKNTTEKTIQPSNQITGRYLENRRDPPKKIYNTTKKKQNEWQKHNENGYKAIKYTKQTKGLKMKSNRCQHEKIFRVLRVIISRCIEVNEKAGWKDQSRKLKSQKRSTRSNTDDAASRKRRRRLRPRRPIKQLPHITRRSRISRLLGLHK